MIPTYQNVAKLSDSRYTSRPSERLEAIFAGGIADTVGWLGGLGVAALAFVFSANAASAQLSQGTITTETPHWLRGPLAGLVSAPSPQALAALTNFGLPAMFLFYCLAVLGSGRLRTRHVFGLAVLAQVIVVIGPSPSPSSDLFPYLEFSRMWTQGLNPYVNSIFAAPHVGLLYGAADWPGALSPYGPLFTLLIAPFSTLPLSAAYWAIRLLILCAMLAAVWLCGLCAEQVGASRPRAIAFVGLNPLILFYCVGGAHNDVLAMLPILTAMLLLLRLRAATAGGVRGHVAPMLGSSRVVFTAGLLLAVGAGFKASVLVFAPAVLLATARRRTAVLGFLVGGATVWLVTVLFFGGYLPALGTQSGFVDQSSVGSLIGRALGLGGETNAVRIIFDALLLLALASTAVLAWRRPKNALTYATWAALSLVTTLPWQEPWYAVLFLCPACCSRSHKLKAVCFGFSLLLLLLFLPDSQWLTGNSDPLSVLQFNALRASQR